MTDPKELQAGTALGSDERRSEPRFVANGIVVLYVNKTPVPGRMTDVSDHGMRVEHMYSELTSGMVLEVESAGERRTARVIWNRIRNEGVESGFYLL